MTEDQRSIGTRWQGPLFLGGIVMAAGLTLWQGWPWWAAALIGLAIGVLGYEALRFVDSRRISNPEAQDPTAYLLPTVWERVWCPISGVLGVLIAAVLGWHWSLAGLLVAGFLELGYATDWLLRILRQRTASPMP